MHFWKVKETDIKLAPKSQISRLFMVYGEEEKQLYYFRDLMTMKKEKDCI
jgi:hypothetical protein